MTPKWIRFLGGTLLAGALALGTVGFVAAQDPGGANGAGMMNGANGAGMMNGANGAGMMNGANGAGMESLHDQMVASGVCDQAQMQSIHTDENPSR